MAILLAWNLKLVYIITTWKNIQVFKTLKTAQINDNCSKTFEDLKSDCSLKETYVGKTSKTRQRKVLHFEISCGK